MSKKAENFLWKIINKLDHLLPDNKNIKSIILELKNLLDRYSINLVEGKQIFSKYSEQIEHLTIKVLASIEIDSNNLAD